MNCRINFMLFNIIKQYYMYTINNIIYLTIIKQYYLLAQTMFRIKDPKKSLHFYRDLLGIIIYQY